MTAIAKTNSELDSRITAYADAIVRNAHVMNGVKHIDIPCSLLRLDEAYQRKESGYAGRIAEQWDNHKAKDIIVSYRDSEFKVIDGANRVRAAMLRGQDTLNCIIYEGRGSQAVRDAGRVQEARIELREAAGVRCGRGSGKRGDDRDLPRIQNQNRNRKRHRQTERS